MATRSARSPSYRITNPRVPGGSVGVSSPYDMPPTNVTPTTPTAPPSSVFGPHYAPGSVTYNPAVPTQTPAGPPASHPSPLGPHYAPGSVTYGAATSPFMPNPTQTLTDLKGGPVNQPLNPTQYATQGTAQALGVALGAPVTTTNLNTPGTANNPMMYGLNVGGFGDSAGLIAQGIQRYGSPQAFAQQLQMAGGPSNLALAQQIMGNYGGGAIPGVYTPPAAASSHTAPPAAPPAGPPASHPSPLGPHYAPGSVTYGAAGATAPPATNSIQYQQAQQAYPGQQLVTLPDGSVLPQSFLGGMTPQQYYQLNQGLNPGGQNPAFTGPGGAVNSPITSNISGGGTTGTNALPGAAGQPASPFPYYTPGPATGSNIGALPTIPGSYYPNMPQGPGNKQLSNQLNWIENYGLATGQQLMNQFGNQYAAQNGQAADYQGMLAQAEQANVAGQGGYTIPQASAIMNETGTFGLNTLNPNANISAFQTGAQGVQGAVGNEAANVNAAIGQYAPSATFGPQDYQDLVTAASNAANAQTGATIQNLQNQAFAAGNVSPMAVQAAINRAQQTGQISAANAMAQARLQADQARIAAAQQQESTSTGAALQSGAQAVGAAQNVMGAGQQATTAQQNEGMNINQLESGRAQNVAQTNLSQTNLGAQYLANEQQQANQQATTAGQQQLSSYGTQQGAANQASQQQTAALAVSQAGSIPNLILGAAKKGKTVEHGPVDALVGEAKSSKSPTGYAPEAVVPIGPPKEEKMAGGGFVRPLLRPRSMPSISKPTALPHMPSTHTSPVSVHPMHLPNPAITSTSMARHDLEGMLHLQGGGIIGDVLGAMGDIYSPAAPPSDSASGTPDAAKHDPSWERKALAFAERLALARNPGLARYVSQGTLSGQWNPIKQGRQAAAQRGAARPPADGGGTATGSPQLSGTNAPAQIPGTSAQEQSASAQSAGNQMFDTAVLPEIMKAPYMEPPKDALTFTRPMPNPKIPIGGGMPSGPPIVPAGGAPPPPQRSPRTPPLIPVVMTHGAPSSPPVRGVGHANDPVWGPIVPDPTQPPNAPPASGGDGGNGQGTSSSTIQYDPNTGTWGTYGSGVPGDTGGGGGGGGYSGGSGDMGGGGSQGQTDPNAPFQTQSTFNPAGGDPQSLPPTWPGVLPEPVQSPIPDQLPPDAGMGGSSGDSGGGFSGDSGGGGYSGFGYPTGYGFGLAHGGIIRPRRYQDGGAAYPTAPPVAGADYPTPLSPYGPTLVVNKPTPMTLGSDQPQAVMPLTRRPNPRVTPHKLGRLLLRGRKRA